MLVTLERSALDAGSLGAVLREASYLAAIQVAELHIGVLLADTDARRIARARFVARVREYCQVIPFGEAESEQMATLFVWLRRNGTLIGEHDLQIAATALTHGHTVMTANVREFSRVPGLSLTPVP